MCQIILILDIVEVGAVHPLYGSSKGSFYQSGSNLQESNLKAMDTSNIPTLEERFVTWLWLFQKYVLVEIKRLNREKHPNVGSVQFVRDAEKVKTTYNKKVQYLLR